MQLHEAVKRARAELGLSRKKLAELSGVQRRQLATLEAGGNVTLSTLRKVLAQLPNLESFTIETATGHVEHHWDLAASERRTLEAIEQFSAALQVWLNDVATGKRVPDEDALAPMRHATNLLMGNLGRTPEEVDAMRAEARARDAALYGIQFPEPEADEEDEDGGEGGDGAGGGGSDGGGDSRRG